MCLPTRRTPSIREPSRVRAISSAGDFSRLVLSPIHTDSMTSPATCRCRVRAVVSTSGSSGTSSVYGSPDELAEGVSKTSPKMWPSPRFRAAPLRGPPTRLGSLGSVVCDFRPRPGAPDIAAQTPSPRKFRTRWESCCERTVLPAPACNPSSVRPTFQAANSPC